MRLLAVGLVLAACASASKSRRCAPIDPELYLDYGGLYDECTAEKRASLTFTPRLDYPYQVQPNVYCLYGSLRFIVDTIGKPIGQTVEVVSGNDQRYVEIMVNYLPQLRFSPAQVKGRAVHQIARWESRMPVRPLTTSRTATPRTTTC